MRILVVLSCLFVLGACDDALHTERGASSATSEYENPTGTIAISLSAARGAGRYALRDATFDLSGSALMTLSTQDAEADAERLASMLPVGRYALFLRPGYALYWVDASGNEERVEAELKGPNPHRVIVDVRRDAHVSLRFISNGEVIVLGTEVPATAMAGEVEITR